MSIDNFRKKISNNLKVRKSTFRPTCDLDDKSNYKPYYKVERDGTIFERIFLDIPVSALREQIICLHYLRNHVKMFLKKQIGINIVSRDNPWDFGIELNTGEKFNVEITSIAEDSDVFKKLKNEERFAMKSVLSEIPFHELKKLNQLFPNKKITELIQSLQKTKTDKNEMISNPYNKSGSDVFLSSRSYEMEPLSNLIQVAIENKENKKHSEKEKTVLIIDNRTLNYELSDFQSAMDTLSDFCKKSIFKEIWFYTGYCSDTNGNNAEFSLAPMKINDIQKSILEKTIKNNKPDENGTMYL